MIHIISDKDRADHIVKLNHELRLARQMVEEKEREVEMYRIREAALTEECKRYKNTMKRLTESENFKKIDPDRDMEQGAWRRGVGDESKQPRGSAEEPRN